MNEEMVAAMRAETMTLSIFNQVSKAAEEVRTFIREAEISALPTPEKPPSHPISAGSNLGFAKLSQRTPAAVRFFQPQLILNTIIYPRG